MTRESQGSPDSIGGDINLPFDGRSDSKLVDVSKQPERLSLTCICMYIYIFKHICVYVICIHIFACIYMHTYMYMHTYIYIFLLCPLSVPRAMTEQ